MRIQHRATADSDAAPRRFWLGMAQMFAATTALILLLSTGPTAITVATAALATVLTLTSRWLARRHREPGD